VVTSGGTGDENGPINRETRRGETFRQNRTITEKEEEA
jgi:hypothetical protein